MLLFNRQFQILSSCNPHFSQGYLYVYRKNITLRIPFSATDIPDEHFYFSLAKLMASSVEETIFFVKECNLLCHLTLMKSGSDCLPVNSKKHSLN
jgi:hypothetical protein